MAKGKVDMLEMGWVASVLGKRDESAAGERGGSFSGVSIDTRTDCNGKLFFALRGARHDGHEFLVDAVSGGARGVVVEKGWGLYELRSVEMSLEDVFLHLVTEEEEVGN